MSTTPTMPAAAPPPKLKRTQHWATRELNVFLRARARTPFAWGTHDCCIFPADAIKAFTGVDIAADFRGKYTDEASAMALIKSVTGGSTVADAAAWCAQKHGLVEHAYPRMAKRGDMVVMQNGPTLVGGIVHLNGRHLVTVGPDGIVRLPITAVKRSWAI